MQFKLLALMLSLCGFKLPCSLFTCINLGTGLTILSTANCSNCSDKGSLCTIVMPAPQEIPRYEYVKFCE